MGCETTGGYIDCTCCGKRNFCEFSDTLLADGTEWKKQEDWY